MRAVYASADRFALVALVFDELLVAITKSVPSWCEPHKAETAASSVRQHALTGSTLSPTVSLSGCRTHCPKPGQRRGG